MDNGLAIRVPAPSEKVVAWLTEALREEGFGVLTPMDVQETMRARFGVRMEPYRILGACHPTPARLDVDRQVYLRVPCDVVVCADDGHVVVAATRPDVPVEAAGRPELEPVAAEACRRLAIALSAVSSVARRAAC
ncbi:MAG TPA: DUF302 domain-containing protein [Micromonosporaceae bacterium]|nr:DUF302 domain-containing protein [Micromonosporaceae bacterium]